jgi:hypothetical protein
VALLDSKNGNTTHQVYFRIKELGLDNLRHELRFEMSLDKCFFVFLAVFCISCAELSRSRESGYADGRRSGTVRKSSKSSISTAPEASGANLSTKSRLKQLENSISNKKEMEQYSKALPWFYNEQERIQFLSLPGFEARQKWLADREFNSRMSEVQSSMKELVEAQDIAVGMPQSLVRQSWGEPDSVEVSGNPQFKNERWRYNRYVSSQDGYKPERRTVYFEGGKVVAWELE